MSPTFFAMQVVVLTSPAPGALRRGWALAAGSMIMLLVISFGGVSLLAQLPSFQTGKPSWSMVFVFLAGATALMLVALRIRTHPQPHHDSMLDKLVDAKPPFIFTVGALRLATNATTLALYLPALHVITSSSVDIVFRALAFLLLFALTEAAVVGPVLAVTVMGERAKPVLTRVHHAIEAHSRTVTLVVCIVFALVLLGLAVGEVVALV